MSNSPSVPAAPVAPVLDPASKYAILQRHVRNALLSLPAYFEFDNPISGINATDLFNLNALLGAGIELKGWWLLSKEGVPSLRYQVAPSACAPHDLICVVPWHLSNAVSGVATVIEPWVESARYAAEYRDYWWQHLRSSRGRTGITYPQTAHPYPSKADLVLARPDEDGGGNFGRLPRAKPLMDAFISRAMRHDVLGIPVGHWVTFLKRHSDTATPEEISEALGAELADHLGAVGPETADHLLRLLDQVGRLLRP